MYAPRQNESVRARCLWQIPLRGQWNTHFRCLCISQRAKGQAWRSEVSAQDSSLFSHPPGTANCEFAGSEGPCSQGCAGHSYCSSRQLQGSLFIESQESGLQSEQGWGWHFLWRCESSNVVPFWQERYFLRLFLRKTGAGLTARVPGCSLGFW